MPIQEDFLYTIYKASKVLLSRNESIKMDEEKIVEIHVVEQGPTCPFCKLGQSWRGRALLVLLFVVIPALLLLSLFL